MNYLDYLPHTSYADLPAAVQSQISPPEYEALRQLTTGLADNGEPMLPAALGQAFQRKIAEGNIALTTAPVDKNAPQRSRWFWIAAAGWLLLAVVMSALLLRQPKEKTVYELVSAPVVAPVVVYDTITQTITEYKTLYQLRYDTVYVPQEVEPELVYVTDTMYLPSLIEPEVQLVKSKAAARERRLLDLLVETE